MENGARECEWRHVPEARGGFWTPNEKGRLSELTEARQVCAQRAPYEMVVVVGSRWKIQNIKNVYLSPYVEEPLNAKVIKVSYLN